MNIVEGNLLDIRHGIIVHQVNCLGVMGRGLASQIRSAYPNVYKEYHKLCKSKVGDEADLLGTMQIVPITDNPVLRVANMFGQCSYMGPGVHTDYLAVKSALHKLSLINIRRIPVFLPYLLGSDLANGNWETIKAIAENIIPDATIVVLPEKVAALGPNWRDRI